MTLVQITNVQQKLNELVIDTSIGTGLSDFNSKLKSLNSNIKSWNYKPNTNILTLYFEQNATSFDLNILKTFFGENEVKCIE